MSIGSWREVVQSRPVPVVPEARLLLRLDQHREEHPGNSSANRHATIRGNSVYVQYIYLKLFEMSRHFRNEILNNRESPWLERPNLVAMGVGLQSKTEQSTAWQILASQINNVSWIFSILFSRLCTRKSVSVNNTKIAQLIIN